DADADIEVLGPQHRFLARREQPKGGIAYLESRDDPLRSVGVERELVGRGQRLAIPRDSVPIVAGDDVGAGHPQIWRGDRTESTGYYPEPDIGALPPLRTRQYQ